MIDKVYGMACGMIWYMVHGIWYGMRLIYSMVYGVWYMVWNSIFMCEGGDSIFNKSVMT